MDVHADKVLSFDLGIGVNVSRLQTLEMDLARRGVYPDARTRASLRYATPDAAFAEQQCRFIWCRRDMSTDEILRVCGATAAPLWVFLRAIPERLDVVAQNLLDKAFDKHAAFVFSGSDGTLCMWRQTLAGNRIEPYTHPSDKESNVWLVGLTPP